MGHGQVPTHVNLLQVHDYATQVQAAIGCRTYAKCRLLLGGSIGMRIINCD